MTTETVRYSEPACSFCGAKEGEYDYLLQKDERTAICDQCFREITVLLEANPGRKHLRYLPKRNKR